MKNSCNTLIIITILILSFGLLLAQRSFQPRTSAPPVMISKWINYTPKDRNVFKGKTVILEFWATWCGPCRMMIPHINKLVKKFASDSVMFISMSKEDPQKVIEFLKHTKLNSNVVIDANGQTNSRYKIRAIPKAFIIDRNGLIAWEGHPASLNEQVIQSIINN